MTTPLHDLPRVLREEAEPHLKELRECVECRGGKGSLCDDCNEADLYAYAKLNAARRIEAALAAVTLRMREYGARRARASDKCEAKGDEAWAETYGQIASAWYGAADMLEGKL